MLELHKAYILALALLALVSTTVVGALLKMNRVREAATRSLRASNQELQKAHELARRRVSILEMVGTHAPLQNTLAAIAELAVRSQPGAGAAFWATTANNLLFQASAGLPEGLTNELRSLAAQLKPDADQGGPSGSVPTIADFPEARSASLDCSAVPLHDVTGDWIGLLVIFFPVSGDAFSPQVSSQMAQLASLAIENISLYERLAFQAQHDLLTGLPNRLLFQDRVQQAIRLAQRNQEKVAILWMDVDRFKSVNDMLGHRTGDELLCEVGRRLRQSIRESDTAARVGGDEFVVLVSNLDSALDATVVAEKIMGAMRVPAVLSGHTVKVSVSMGISIFPHHGSEPAALMRSADLAMYRAKRAGRDMFQVFLPQFGESLSRRMQIEQALRDALEAGEFHVEYQPLIDRDDRLDGFEALLRWNSGKLGSVSPAEFIPIAEEAGLIIQIGEWVTRVVCSDGAQWLAEGLDVPRIAINASGFQFADREFSAMIRAVLEETGFPPSRLEIEVTETALVQNLDRALEQIALLRDIGIKFAIDDFGTGYSSLNQLRTLPVDYVKVDRSFIKDLDLGRGDSIMLVRGIVKLAHDLRLRVVAEGVETDAQLSLLRSLGCDLSQGFFLYRPMQAPAAAALIRSYAAGQAAAPELVPA